MRLISSRCRHEPWPLGDAANAFLAQTKRRALCGLLAGERTTPESMPRPPPTRPPDHARHPVLSVDHREDDLGDRVPLRGLFRVLVGGERGYRPRLSLPLVRHPPVPAGARRGRLTMDRHYYFFEGVHGVVIARTRHEWKVQSVVRKTRD